MQFSEDLRRAQREIAQSDVVPESSSSGTSTPSSSGSANDNDANANLPPVAAAAPAAATAATAGPPPPPRNRNPLDDDDDDEQDLLPSPVHQQVAAAAGAAATAPAPPAAAVAAIPNATPAAAYNDDDDDDDSLPPPRPIPQTSFPPLFGGRKRANDKTGDDDPDNNPRALLEQTNHKNKKRKCTDCYCCVKRKFSRDGFDDRLRERILPRVPVEERCILWDIDSLPMTTNCDIPTFSLLRQVFLFLPFELRTMLAAASTCRSWRIALDRHWAWKYLLPLKNEVMHLVTGLRWDKPAAFERKYFTSDADGDTHYVYAIAEDIKKRGPSNPIESNQFDAAAVCQLNCLSCACCCIGCGYCCKDGVCCRDDDEFRGEWSEQRNLRQQKLQQFRDKQATGQLALHMTTEEDRKLAQQSVPQRRREVNWFERLKNRVVAPLGDQQQQQQQQNNDKSNNQIGVPFAGAGAAPAAAAANGGSNNNDHDDETDGEEAERDEDDEDNYVWRDAAPPLDGDDNNNNSGIYGTARSAGAAAKANSNSNNDGDNEEGMHREVSMPADKPPQASFAFVSYRHGIVANNDNSMTDYDCVKYKLDRYGGGNIATSLRANRTTLVSTNEIKKPPPSKMKRRRRGNNNNDDDDDEDDDSNPFAARPPPPPWKVKEDERLDKIFAGTSFRQQWMFHSLSSFTSTTRQIIARCREEMKIGTFDHLRNTWRMPLTMTILFVICFGFAVGVGLETPSGGTIWPANDRIVGRNVALIVTTLYICVMCFLMTAEQFEEWMKPTWIRSASLGRGYANFMAVTVLLALCVPASLVGLRVTSAQMLLDGGSISVCDAWSNITTTTVAELAGTTITKAADLIVDGHTLQCRIPESLRPSRLAAATFLELPPGTRLLYHPPSVGQRTVPFTASRSSTDSDTCTISQPNSVVSNFDAGANMTRTDVDRGYIGYYTVFLPSSCDGAAAVKNATVMIIGDHPECPWWSYSSQFNATAENNNNVQMDSKFWSVLSNTTASEAIGNATSISGALGAAVTNLPATASAAKVQCTTAENVMVTVRGGGGADRHKFYLRVATGFQPHWTASYYHCRQPCDDGPWATRAKWTDTLDWQLNGIVALTADTSMFLAHENSVSPVVPEQLPPFDGVWSDDGNAPFWTGAHPAGLRKLHLDMWNGLVGLLIFCGVYLAVVSWLTIFGRHVTSCLLQFMAGFLLIILTVVPLPLLVVTSICYAKAETLDMAELRQPVVCLQTSREDILGLFIVTVILSCIMFCFLLLALFIVWAMGRGDEDDYD